jgi:hypothetical protein
MIKFQIYQNNKGEYQQYQRGLYFNTYSFIN